ncbi:MAG: hypothetical protein ABL863_05145 [Nitrosomonas sp.]
MLKPKAKPKAQKSLIRIDLLYQYHLLIARIIVSDNHGIVSACSMFIFTEPNIGTDIAHQMADKSSKITRYAESTTILTR